jgi:signal transduction histidine kinase
MPITLQVALIALASVLLAHLVAVAIFVVSAPPSPAVYTAAARLGAIARVFVATPAERRGEIVDAALRSGLSLRLADASDPALSERESMTHLTLERDLAAERETATLAHVETASVLAIALPPGDRWLVLDLAAESAGDHDRPWFGPVVDLVLSTVPLALLSIWAARRVARPLVRLASTARAISAIADPVPLPEEGAREIRDVSRAFNAVLRRLRRLVVDRTRMLAAISHDLRTPLTRLRLRADGVEDPVTREKMLSDIMRMDGMITSILDFIREESRQERIERLDIAVLLQTVCDAFADSGGDASYVGPLHLALACRPLALERAVSNIVDNAIKFGGRAEIRLSTEETGASIVIEDEGPGIPEAERAELLEPFTRGDRARDRARTWRNDHVARPGPERLARVHPPSDERVMPGPAIMRPPQHYPPRRQTPSPRTPPALPRPSPARGGRAG